MLGDAVSKFGSLGAVADRTQLGSILAAGKAPVGEVRHPVWTDSVAIAGEDQTLAIRHRTRESDLVVPAELSSQSQAGWQRHGRCAEVLAELFELPDPGQTGTAR